MLALNGCASSLIKVDFVTDRNSHSQYGKSSNREFHFKESINPSIVEKWEAEINGGFSNSSITAYDSLIFINDLSGRIYCFSIANGKTIGQLKYKGTIFTAPVIHKSMLIYIVNSEKENISTVYFYDFKSGKEITSTEIKGRVTSQLVKAENSVIAVAESGVIYSFDLLGHLNWQFSTNESCHGSPAAIGDYVILGNDKGEIIKIDIGDNVSSNQANGRVKFRQKIGGSLTGGIVILENDIYIGSEDGNLYAIDLADGKTRWIFQTGSRVKMDAAIFENDVYIGNLNGDFFKLSKKDGSLIWKLKTDGLLNITPLLTANFVVLPDANKKLYFISNSTGEIIDYIETEGRMKLNPVIKNNLLFIGYENGYLKAYEVYQN